MNSSPPLRTSGLGLALALILGSATAPLPAAAAPLEADFGAADGYPAAERGNWFRPRFLVSAHTSLHAIYPSRPVPGAGSPRPLPEAPAKPDWPFIDRYLASHPATGLLVLKDGQILVERYQYGRQATDRFTSWSMAKTLVGMAIGIAIADGQIASIDDPVDRYDLALARTAWKGVSIRHVLTMSSGVRFDESYDKPDSDIARFSRAWSLQAGSLAEGLQQYTAVERPPGDRFHYISVDTQVLSQVLQQATGQTLSAYVAERIWAPMGAEADGAWVLDAVGNESANCCFSARLRDWGRLGLLLADRGQRDGKPVIPADWVEAATTVRFRDFHLQPRRATPYMGYGYQTWVFPDGLGFALQGVRGQAVFVHPRLKLVMVQTAVWPASISSDYARQRDELWRELVLRAGRL